MKKQLTAFFLAFAMAFAVLSPVPAKAASERKAAGSAVLTPAEEWELQEDADGGLYVVSPRMEGRFTTPNEVYYAWMDAYFHNDILFFRIFGDEEGSFGLWNPVDTPLRQPVMIYTDSGVLGCVDAIWIAGSYDFYLDPEGTLLGMPASKLIEQDLRTGGATRLWIASETWDGEALDFPILFRFDLTAESESFRSGMNTAREQGWGLSDPQAYRDVYVKEKNYIDSGWTKVYWTDAGGAATEQYQIQTSVSGYAVAQDLTVSPIKAVAAADTYGFILGLQYWDGETWQFLRGGGTDHTTSLRLRTQNGDTWEAPVVLRSGNNYYEFPEEQRGGGSVEDKLISCLYKKERADLALPMVGWGGRTGVNTVLYLVLASDDGSFHDLYYDAYRNGWTEPDPSLSTAPAVTPAPAVSSVYTDDQIRKLCNDYRNTFRYAVPVCEDLYNIVMSDDTGLLDYILAFAYGASSMKALSDFYNAKVAFEGVAYEDLTVDQQNLYTQTKNAVDSTRAGQIIRLIEKLYQLGLL